MKLRSIIVWSALALSACGVHIKPSPGPTPGPTPPPPPAYTERTNVLHVRDGAKPLTGCAVAYTLPLSNLSTKTTIDTGDASWLVRIPNPDPGGGRNAQVKIECPGYEPFADSFVIAETGNQDIWFGGTYSAGNQPMLRKGPQQNAPWLTVTDDQLRAYRGSISTTLMPLPCGPRPNAADNILFTAEFGSTCYDATTRAAMLATYRARSYTHWAIGPIESGGYSGQFPRQDWTGNADGFADLLEQVWRSGEIPTVFLLPDTGFCADGLTIDRQCVEQRLTPIYSSPRYQALVKIAVLAWEPNFGSDDYVWAVEWMARTFPHALRGLHFESGHAAPCRGSELAEYGGTIANEGACWVRVASKLHFFLAQNTWTFGGENLDAGRTPLQQFLYNLWDMGRRFTDGASGWPKGADGKPIELINFEYGSYYVYRHGARYVDQAVEWGNAGLTAAPFADPSGHTVDAAKYVIGYGDGGTVDVAPKRFTFSLTPSSTSAPRYTFTIHPKG